MRNLPRSWLQLKGHNPCRLTAVCIAISAGCCAACTGNITDAPAFESAGVDPDEEDEEDEQLEVLDASVRPPPRDAAAEPRPRRDAGSQSSAPIYCDAPGRVFELLCGTSSCHGNEDAVFGDFAVSPERAVALVDKVSVRGPSCGRLIDSRNYADSLLLTKVTGTYPPQCGGRMPVGSFTITDDEIGCIASWLQQFQE